MNKDHDTLLREAAPNLCNALKSSPPHCFPLFGFECGDGWFDLLLDLLRKLEAKIMLLPEAERSHVYLNQVKEKFGTLRCYLSTSTDAMEGLIREAEAKSAVTCETCGAPGELRGKSWIYVACEDCELERRVFREIV